MCFEGMSHANLTTSPHWEGGCHWKEKSQPFARQVGCFLMIFTVWQALVILIRRGLLIPGMKCSIFLGVTNVDRRQEHPNDVQMLHPSHSSKHSASGHPHSWLATSGLDRAKVRPQPGLTEGNRGVAGRFWLGDSDLHSENIWKSSIYWWMRCRISRQFSSNFICSRVFCCSFWIHPIQCHTSMGSHSPWWSGVVSPVGRPMNCEP